MAMLRPPLCALIAALALSACFIPPDGDDGDDSGGEAATDLSTGMSTSVAGTSMPSEGSTADDVSSSSGGSSLDASGGTTGGVRGGEMVEVPGGTFMMGCDPANDATCVDTPVHPHILTERPRHEVTLSPYAIDRTEVTLAEYDVCVEEGACTEAGSNWPECNVLANGHDEHPVDCVTWEQGDAYCQWAGKRLPTEAEWEYAARGDDERLYPWGNEPPDCSRANIHFNDAAGCGIIDTYVVGSLPAGASPFGVMDMCGNVAEFVADSFSESYYEKSPAEDPQGPEADETGARVMRGGGYNYPSDPWILRASSRTSYDSSVPSPQIGFRCARSL